MLVFDYFGMFDYDEAGGDIYEYTSEEFSSLIQGITGNGISANYLNQFEATANGLDITIKSGAAFINGRWGYNSAAKTISLSPTTSTTKRIDRIVIELDVASRVIGFNTLVGTATTGTPTAPALNDNQIAVCSVLVANGSTTTLTDERVFTYSAAEVQKQLNELKANASNHTHGLITHDGKLTNQSNKVMVVDSTGSITAYGGTAVRGMIGAEAANTCLPLAGGTMTGAINFGEATRGVYWTTANGTVWSLRPYYSGNVFQLTLKPTGKAEYGALNIDANGNADFSSEIAAKGYIKGKRFRAEADNDYPTYEFKANSQTNYGGMMQMGSTNMFGFYEYPKEFDGQSTRYYEGYMLPEPSTGLTANKSYKILTTKVAVSIAQGGTGATTAAGALSNLGAVPLAGGATISGNMTFGGNLWVSNDSSAGGYVKIWEDNEGGNIAIGSKSGKAFEIDAYNDTTLRIFSQQSGSVKGMNLNGTNGNLSIDGDYYRGGNRVADVQHGSLEVGTSGKTITFPHAFAGVPSVTATGSKFCHLYVKDITKTGCTLVSGEGKNTVNWIAAY